MHILTLPPEILDIILHHSIIVRGFPRALRLKLVCKTFSASFKRIIFHTKELDNPKWGTAFRNGHTSKHHDGVDTLWHDYLVFRCREKQDKSVACYVEIRNVVDHLFRYNHQTQANPPDWDSILDRICWLALECPVVGHGTWQGWNGHRSEPPKLGLRILSAATYCRYTPLVRELLSQRHDPTKDDDLFPSPMYIAARTGQADMLRLFQEHLPHFEPGERSNPDSWRSKIEPGSLVGAAVRGDMDMVRLCLYPPSREMPEDEDHELILGFKPGFIPGSTPLGTYIGWGMWRATSPEVHRYLLSLLLPNEGGDHPQDQMKNHHLATAAGAGNIGMVRYLLDMGADPSARSSGFGTPLSYAVRACNDDVVDLFLQRGADPNERSAYKKAAFPAAAKAGSMVMMRKLLDAGGEVLLQRGGGGYYTLQYAIRMEHMGMVEMLLELGGGSEELRARAIKMANKMGLEGMAEQLRLGERG